MKKRRGFTLIELVIVVAILGVLSSIALVKYTDVSKNSKENSDYVTASNIATATKLAINEGKLSNGTNIEISKISDYLDGNPKPQSIDNSKFLIDIDEGGITVKSGDGKDAKIFYPKDIKTTES